MKIQENQVSWLQKARDYFPGYPAWLIDGGIGVLIGFFVGFLSKNFGKPLFFTVIILLIAGYVLSYFGLILINIGQIKQMAGIVEIPTLDIAFTHAINWMRDHIALCIGTVIGFAIGWRVGA